MAEEQGSRDTSCQHPEDTTTYLKENKAQSVMEPKPVDLDVKQQPSDVTSLSCTSVNEESTNSCGGDPSAVRDAISAQGDNLHDIDKTHTHVGDYKRESPKDKKTADPIPGKGSCPSATAEKDQTRNKTDLETATSPIPVEKDDKEEIDGINKTSSTTKDMGKEEKHEFSTEEAAYRGFFNKTTHQPDKESHGDYKRESQKHEKTADKIPGKDSFPGEVLTGKETDLKTTTSQISDEREEEETVDGLKTGTDEESLTIKNTESEEDAVNSSASEEKLEKQENTTPPQMQRLQEADVVEESDKQRNVETIGPTTTEASESLVSKVIEFLGGRLMAVSIVVLLVAIVLLYLPQQEAPTPKNELRQIDIFLKQLEKVKTQYPNQRAELWDRSRIHLKRHLQTTQPTEPVSLILTAGRRAERTLHCLAHSLAYAFSSALNASVLHIDGASKANQDSDQVKLDIDSKLQRAFEGDKPVAVIHRFEELPPGSTLIFYRYCDHENAAYKKTFLIFTVLLDEEKDIPAKTHLSVVEEMVDDHLQKKFLSHGHPVSFDRMDLDKYGGLWSRISHLILPVAAEKNIEHEGC